MSSPVEQIKDRLNIADVVGSYVTLEKSGRNFRAHCPFHNERTPSFFVSPERGTYHCFGCDAGGDIFEFVEKFEGVDFYGALKILAAKAGVALERSDPRARDEKEHLYKVLDGAASFYEKTLVDSPHALKYLAERGIGDASRTEWRLGFAPNEWQGLLSFFSSRGVKEDILIKAGLVARSRERRCYDRFRGRIMFPISDSSGRIIAFSARVLPVQEVPKSASAQSFSEAKYINSPETELYRKSVALYGFDKAKQAIREKNTCIVVEGQMDVIITHQAGVRNAVATSGTALTEEHLGRIRRFAEKIVFAFDADAAGFAAAERGLVLALGNGMNVALAHLPQKMDPAELGCISPKSLAERLENAQHAIDFFLTVLKENSTDPRRLAIEAGKKILPLIAHMKNRIEQAHFIAEMARQTGVREDALWEEFKIVRAEGFGANKKPSGEKPAQAPRSRETAIAERLTGILLWQRSVGSEQAVFLKNTEREIESLLGVPFSEVVNRFSPRDREKIVFEAEHSYGERGLKEDDVQELVRNLKESMVRARIRNATLALGEAEGAHNESLAEQISKEISILKKSISF